MRRIRLTILFLLPFLCVFATPPHSSSSQSRQQKQVDPATSIEFTVQTRDQEPRFFEPLHLQVLLRNNGEATHSLDLGKLRLRPAGWWGWSGGGSGLVEDIPMALDNNQQQQVVLPAHGSLMLSGVDSNATINTLGKVELRYVLVTTDTSNSPFISGHDRTKEDPNIIHDPHETTLTLEIGPSTLISSIWASQSNPQRERLQPQFNEFLRNAAAVEAHDNSIRDRSYVDGTLNFAGGYSLEFLKAAARDGDPVVREQAVLKCPYAVWAIDELNSFLDELDKHKPRPGWAANLVKIANSNAEATGISLALAALKDAIPKVRIAALKVLADQKVRSAFIAVKLLAADQDSGVRAAAQEYLGKFAGENVAAEVIASSLADKNIKVREQALSALLHSPKPPPLDTIKHSFAAAKGATAVGLLSLLFEQEDATLSDTLATGFTARSPEERLAIMTAIGGHREPSALTLVQSGLDDTVSAVQRAALMRLLAFPAKSAVPLVDAYIKRAQPELQVLAQAVRREIETRRLWPFLATTDASQISANESLFPSQNGTAPVVSPDANWIAYEETGWGRPGGTGGFGSSNRISISHAVRTNGTDDRIVSDMYLVGWLSDSSRLFTARDSYVAVSDLNGNVLAEFGDPLEDKYRRHHEPGVDWRNDNLREQFGGEMPHQKYIRGSDDITFKNGGGYSPDGHWYGPITRNHESFFLAPDGERITIQLPSRAPRFGFRAIWSPSGRHVLFYEDDVWLVFDMQTRTSRRVPNPDQSDFPGEAGAGNPWSKDGSLLTFLRAGQVWISGPNGENPKQLTFDSTRKALPTFSRSGRFIAYITWQPDDRLHYTRLGPTDLWIVDSETTLATRVTEPGTDRINSVDWIDEQTLIFDRHQLGGEFTWPNPRSSLRRLSLAQW